MSEQTVAGDMKVNKAWLHVIMDSHCCWHIFCHVGLRLSARHVKGLHVFVCIVRFILSCCYTVLRIIIFVCVVSHQVSPRVLERTVAESNF